MGTGAAVVTGAASGIGRALAHALHDRGARVVLADRDHDALEALAAELHAPAVSMDVTSADDYARLAQAAGPIDLVCLNAGISIAQGGPVWETSAAQRAAGHGRQPRGSRPRTAHVRAAPARRATTRPSRTRLTGASLLFVDRQAATTRLRGAAVRLTSRYGARDGPVRPPSIGCAQGPSGPSMP